MNVVNSVCSSQSRRRRRRRRRPKVIKYKPTVVRFSCHSRKNTHSTTAATCQASSLSLSLSHDLVVCVQRLQSSTEKKVERCTNNSHCRGKKKRKRNLTTTQKRREREKWRQRRRRTSFVVLVATIVANCLHDSPCLAAGLFYRSLDGYVRRRTRRMATTFR